MGSKRKEMLRPETVRRRRKTLDKRLEVLGKQICETKTKFAALMDRCPHVKVTPPDYRRGVCIKMARCCDCGRAFFTNEYARMVNGSGKKTINIKKNKEAS